MEPNAGKTHGVFGNDLETPHGEDPISYVGSKRQQGACPATAPDRPLAEHLLVLPVQAERHLSDAGHQAKKLWGTPHGVGHSKYAYSHPHTIPPFDLPAPSTHFP